MYTADFETTTDPEDCRVWAWAVYRIEDDTFDYGNSIGSFMEFVEMHPDTYYFHNLKFDGEFIMIWLMNHGFTHNPLRKLIPDTFQTIISTNGQFYQLKVCFDKRKKKKAITATFKDSLKKLPFSVDSIARSFDLPLNKLSIDYNESRPVGHRLTDDEIAYIHNDVAIVAQALRLQFEQDLKKLTISSDAFNHFKDACEHFQSYFPVLDRSVDAYIRQCYRGGWTYANPRYQADEEHENRCVGAGIVLDVNSLYPSVMYDRELPIGEPLYFKGQYEFDNIYPLHMQLITCKIKLKDKHLPTVQVKGSPFFMANEYITETDGFIDLALTDVDLALLFENYDVDVLYWNGGFKFRSAKGLFCKYIDHWMDIKATNTGGKRQIAKLMMNSLYGKFATNPDCTQKVPYLKENGALAYHIGKPEERQPIYTAMGCWITAYARDVTIRAAMAHHERFLYADTDSLHLLGDEIPDDLRIHPTDLGSWALESRFDKGKYLRAKTYIEHVTHVGNKAGGLDSVEPYLDVKVAGMPKNVKHMVTFDNLKRGMRFEGKLLPKHVAGGIVLEPVTFSIL